MTPEDREKLDRTLDVQRELNRMGDENERLRKALERLTSAAEMVLESHLKGYDLVKPMAVLSSNAVAARTALGEG
jgi:hypothetical protein